MQGLLSPTSPNGSIHHRPYPYQRPNTPSPSHSPTLPPAGTPSYLTPPRPPLPPLSTSDFKESKEDSGPLVLGVPLKYVSYVSY